MMNFDDLLSQCGMVKYKPCEPGRRQGYASANNGKSVIIWNIDFDSHSASVAKYVTNSFLHEGRYFLAWRKDIRID